MAVILCIETATRVCSVALGKNGTLLSLRETHTENSHSSQLTGLIAQVLEDAALSLHDLDAVSVSKGPGSYTGLRIGVSTAKGLCFALDKPLISVGTLLSIALGAWPGTKALGMKDALFVPLIDARRMEVYRAIYDESGTELLSPHAEILTEASFAAYAGHSLVFAGDGAEKCKLLFPPSGQYLYPDLLLPSAQHMLQDAEDSFRQNAFEDLAYFEPYYLKDFIAGKPKVKGLQ